MAAAIVTGGAVEQTEPRFLLLRLLDLTKRQLWPSTPQAPSFPFRCRSQTTSASSRGEVRAAIVWRSCLSPSSLECPAAATLRRRRAPFVEPRPLTTL